MTSIKNLAYLLYYLKERLKRVRYKKSNNTWNPLALQTNSIDIGFYGLIIKLMKNTPTSTDI
jgi:hypothetical protein